MQPPLLEVKRRDSYEEPLCQRKTENAPSVKKKLLIILLEDKLIRGY
jgi:ribosomal protein S21